jgi:hypothetical protein
MRILSLSLLDIICWLWNKLGYGGDIFGTSRVSCFVALGRADWVWSSGMNLVYALKSLFTDVFGLGACRLMKVLVRSLTRMSVLFKSCTWLKGSGGKKFFFRFADMIEAGAA